MIQMDHIDNLWKECEVHHVLIKNCEDLVFTHDYFTQDWMAETEDLYLDRKDEYQECLNKFSARVITGQPPDPRSMEILIENQSFEVRSPKIELPQFSRD